MPVNVVTAPTNQRSKPRASIARALCVGLLGVMLTSGCSNPVGLSSSTLVPEQSALTYFQWLQSASADAIQAEQRSLSRAAANPQLRDVKLGLLLSLRPNATTEDTVEAEHLLTTVINADAHPNLPLDYQIFAEHWLQVLQQQVQLRESSDRQNNTQVSLEELRGRYDDLEHRFEVLTEVRNSLEKQNALLEQQNRLMQQQIDALTIIEQQLVEQDQGNAGNAP